MARDGYGLPPVEHAVETVEALIDRARQLQRSAGRVRDTDLRTAFFLATIGLEEVMQGFLIWSYGVGMAKRTEIAHLLDTGNRHQIRQQLAVGLFQLLDLARPKIRKIEHKKPHYQAVKLAEETVEYVVVRHGDHLSLDNLRHWDGLKMACLYVDWDATHGLIADPVTADHVDAVVDATNRLINQVRLFNNRPTRRLLLRHRRDFERMMARMRATYGP